MKKFDYSEQIDINDIRKQISGLDISSFNEKILLCLALYKSKEGLKPSFVKIEFFEKNSELPPELQYDYEQLIVIRKHVSFNEFLDFLGRVEDGEEIQVNSKTFVIKLQRTEVSYVFSNQNWGFTKPEYPTIYYHAQFTTDTDGYLPNTPLTGTNCQPYPNSDKALIHLFNVVVKKYNQIDRRLIITIPQFKARIKSVKIFDTKIDIQIETKNTPLEHLQIQYYITGNGYTITEAAKKISSNSFSIETKDEPLIVLVILTDLSGDVIDKKEINTEYMYGDSNVEVVIPDYTLKELISKGENKNLEFKARLNEPERFVRTVVAFGNTKGGRIILGVDEKNGKFVSVTEPDKAKESIMNYIAQYCDPKIDVNFQYSQELKVLVIEVPEGQEKPYFLKDEGVFVRHGATNRHASKSELDNLLKRENIDSNVSGFA